jgi:hypothetical protein
MRHYLCRYVYFNAELPQRNLSTDSKDSVKQTVSVLSTLTALVLGLLIGAAKSSYDGKSEALTEMAVNIMLLDRVMAQYGPETAASRKLLRDHTAAGIDEFWSGDRFGVSRLDKLERTDAVETIQENLRGLSPGSDDQRELRSRALAVSGDLAKAHWLTVARSGGTIPTPFLIVLVAWLAISFAGLGLLAARNATVISAGIAAALAVAAAVFLILELDTPYDGVIVLSDEPLRLALQRLGR